ncbi:MAG TPA: hypothetical protein VN829_15225 [Dongiaceae bacterium]|nr:hypothetical protein [Dongiaceae bacterium]
MAEALIDEGITVLRYGGSMVNDPHYRWKKMIQGFMPAKPTATVEQLAGALDAVNTAQAPERLSGGPTL